LPHVEIAATSHITMAFIRWQEQAITN
jgi:hypothetical protein